MLKVLKNRIIIAGWHAVRTSIVLAPELCIRVWLDKKNTQKFSLELERQLQLLNLRIEHVEKSTLKKICGNDRHQGVVLERRVPAQINFTAFIENVLEAKNADDLAEIAKAAGFTISSNEIQNIESPLEVLSDGELEGVAGGGLDNSNGKIFFF